MRFARHVDSTLGSNSAATAYSLRLFLVHVKPTGGRAGVAQGVEQRGAIPQALQRPGSTPPSRSADVRMPTGLPLRQLARAPKNQPLAQVPAGKSAEPQKTSRAVIN